MGDIKIMKNSKEEKGGKSELPKLEGLKWPDGTSFVSGLTANHLQWIYEPASLIMMTISFYSYKYFFDQRENGGLMSAGHFLWHAGYQDKFYTGSGGCSFWLWIHLQARRGKFTNAGQRFRFRAWFP